jgi:hypothetical protein
MTAFGDLPIPSREPGAIEAEGDFRTRAFPGRPFEIWVDGQWVTLADLIERAQRNPPPTSESDTP